MNTTLTTSTAAPTAGSPTAAAGMRTIIQTGYGGAEVFTVGHIDRPTVAASEVLVEVHAAGLDRGTWHLMRGLPYAVRAVSGVRGPKRRVPGLDVAGVVVEVGSAVTRFAVGDEVFGISTGAFAEFAAAREDKLAHKPAALSFEQAAATPVSGITALQAVRDVGRVEAGQRVLITGASGGVGSFAVQIARALGAHVTGVCSAAKADLVRSLGADRVLDYATDDFADGSATYDVIIDIAGNATLSRLRRALAPGGTLVITGGEGGGKWFGGTDRQLRALALSPFTDQRLTTFIAKEHHAGLDVLAEYAAGGRVIPSVDGVFPLDGVPEAMRRMERGEVRGKLVISMGVPA